MCNIESKIGKLKICQLSPYIFVLFCNDCYIVNSYSSDWN